MTWSGSTRASLEGQRVFPTTESGSVKAWVGVGGSPESVVRAAHYGLPLVLAIIGGDPRRFGPYIDLYRRALASSDNRRGRSPFIPRATSGRAMSRSARSCGPITRGARPSRRVAWLAAGNQSPVRSGSLCRRLVVRRVGRDGGRQNRPYRCRAGCRPVRPEVQLGPSSAREPDAQHRALRHRGRAHGPRAPAEEAELFAGSLYTLPRASPHTAAGRADWRAVELIIVGNPDPDSTLPYLVRADFGGLVFRTKGTWPRTNALYCHPGSGDRAADVPEASSGSPCRPATAGRGDRHRRRTGPREALPDRLHPSPRPGHGVLATAAYPETGSTRCATPDGQGRPAPKWRSWSTLTSVTPTASRPAGRTVTRALPCGDYGVTFAGNLVASVERKSLSDLVAQPDQRAPALRSRRARRSAARRGRRRGPLLPGVRPRADPPAVVADGLAELQVRWPSIPIVFCETGNSPRSGPSAIWPWRGSGPRPKTWRWPGWGSTTSPAVRRAGADPPRPRCAPGPQRGHGRHRPWPAPPRDPRGLARAPSTQEAAEPADQWG